MLFRRQISDAGGYLALGGLVIAIGGPLFLLATAAVTWLVTGEWKAITNYDALIWLGIDVRPHFSWVGLQQLAECTLSGPLWISSGVIGAILF